MQSIKLRQTLIIKKDEPTIKSSNLSRKKRLACFPGLLNRISNSFEDKNKITRCLTEASNK